MNTGNGNHQKDDSESLGPPKSTGIVEAQTHDQANNGKNATENPKSDKGKSLKRSWKASGPVAKLTVVFSGIAALATVVYAIVAGWQLVEIHSGGQDTHNLAVAAGQQAEASIIQAQRSEALASAATIQANAALTQVQKLEDGVRESHALALEAKRANDISRSSLETQQRAWIGFTGFDLGNNIEVGQTLSISGRLLNSGNTPAIHVQILATVQTLCGAFPLSPPYPRSPGVASDSLILPNTPRSTRESIADSPLTAINMSFLRSPDCNLYGYGKVTYSDTFGHRHWRHACTVWVKTTAKSLNDCGTYNDGDEDYPDGKEPK